MNNNFFSLSSRRLLLAMWILLFVSITPALLHAISTTVSYKGVDVFWRYGVDYRVFNKKSFSVVQTGRFYKRATANSETSGWVHPDDGNAYAEDFIPYTERAYAYWDCMD